MARPQRSDGLHGEVMALARVHTADGKEDTAAGRQLAGRPRVVPIEGPEAQGVHAVRDHADLVGRDAEAHSHRLQRAADGDHALGTPQGEPELRSMERVAGQPDDATAQGDHHWHAEEAAEEDGGDAVRIGEVGVDHVEGEAAPETDQHWGQRGRVEPAVEPLGDAGNAEEAGVEHGYAIPLLDGREASHVGTADGRVGRKPRDRRHHPEVGVAGDPAHALVDEDPEGRLLRVGVHRAQDEDAHGRPYATAS